jgi:hypothetical protein
MRPTSNIFWGVPRVSTQFSAMSTRLGCQTNQIAPHLTYMYVIIIAYDHSDSSRHFKNLKMERLSAIIKPSLHLIPRISSRCRYRDIPEYRHHGSGPKSWPLNFAPCTAASPEIFHNGTKTGAILTLNYQTPGKSALVGYNLPPRFRNYGGWETHAKCQTFKLRGGDRVAREGEPRNSPINACTHGPIAENLICIFLLRTIVGAYGGWDTRFSWKTRPCRNAI